MLIWILADGNISKYQAYKTLIARFGKEYPDLKVSFEIKSKNTLWKTFFRFLRDPKRNPLADIVEIPHSWTSLFSKLGLFLELEPILGKIKIEDYPHFLVPAMRAEDADRIFSIPLWVEAQSLQYRKDMLKEFSSINMSMLSWQDLLDICSALKKKNKKKDFYPLDNFNPSVIDSDDVLSCVLNRGGLGYFSKDLGSCDILKDETISGIEDYFELFKLGYMPIFQENFHEAAFIGSGLSAMTFSWRMPIKIGKSVMQTALMPAMRRRTNVVRSCNLAVSCNCKEIDESGVFINWLMEYENASFLRKQIGVFPAKEKELKKQEDLPQAYREIFASVSAISNFTVYPTFEKILSSALFDTSVDLARGDYQRENLIKRLMLVKGETDYLLSIY